MSFLILSSPPSFTGTQRGGALFSLLIEKEGRTGSSYGSRQVDGGTTQNRTSSEPRCSPRKWETQKKPKSRAVLCRICAQPLSALGLAQCTASYLNPCFEVRQKKIT